MWGESDPEIQKAPRISEHAGINVWSQRSRASSACKHYPRAVNEFLAYLHHTRSFSASEEVYTSPGDIQDCRALSRTAATP